MGCRGADSNLRRLSTAKCKALPLTYTWSLHGHGPACQAGDCSAGKASGQGEPEGTELVGGEDKALGGPKSSPPILTRRLPRGQSLLGGVRQEKVRLSSEAERGDV